MKKIILKTFFLSLLFYSTNLKSQTDIGYDQFCFERYYPNIIFGRLLELVDTNEVEELCQNNLCSLRIYLVLNTETFMVDTIIYRDICSIFSLELIDSFNTLIYKEKFNLCHNEFLRKDLKAKILYENQKQIKFGVGSLCFWYKKKQLLNESLNK